MIQLKILYNQYLEGSNIFMVPIIRSLDTVGVLITFLDIFCTVLRKFMYVVLYETKKLV